MSINTAIDFSISLIGDGSSTSIEIPLAAAPFLFRTLSGSSQSSPLFSLLTMKPVSVVNVTAGFSGGPIPITSAILDSESTNLTVTFVSAVPAISLSLEGTFLF